MDCTIALQKCHISKCVCVLSRYSRLRNKRSPRFINSYFFPRATALLKGLRSLNFTFFHGQEYFQVWFFTHVCNSKYFIFVNFMLLYVPSFWQIFKGLRLSESLRLLFLKNFLGVMFSSRPKPIAESRICNSNIWLYQSIDF